MLVEQLSAHNQASLLVQPANSCDGCLRLPLKLKSDTGAVQWAVKAVLNQDAPTGDTRLVRTSTLKQMK